MAKPLLRLLVYVCDRVPPLRVFVTRKLATRQRVEQ